MTDDGKDEQDRFIPLCAPAPTLPSNSLIDLPADKFRDSIQYFGSVNVEQALVFIARVTDPRDGRAINLPADDEGVYAILTNAFDAAKRQEINSGDFQAQLQEAFSTVLYTFKLPITMHTDGNFTVPGQFGGSGLGLVRWVRQVEATMIDDPAVRDAANSSAGPATVTRLEPTAKVPVHTAHSPIQTSVPVTIGKKPQPQDIDNGDGMPRL